MEDDPKDCSVKAETEKETLGSDNNARDHVCSSTTEQISDDEDEIVELKDILKAQKDCEETARVLYGAQDDTVCTWPEGYKPRQPILWCKTCTPHVPSGVCLGCSVHCHEGHDLLELYTKRNFRCDCGNERFGDNKCSLYENKSVNNEFNSYNHNFTGTFCVCKETFPGETEEVMVQCVMCEDWFHLSHLNVDNSVPKWKEVFDGRNSLVCTGCTSKFPFLLLLESHEEACFDSFKPQEHNCPLSLHIGWRDRMCKCEKCKSITDIAGCSFIFDDEDDLEKFEEENMKNSKKNDIEDSEVVSELVNRAGRDVAVNVLRGYNELKQNLGAFFNEKAQAGAVITAADVTSFFDQIKRRRMDPEQ